MKIKNTSITLATMAAVLFANAAIADSANLPLSPAKAINLTHTIANSCKNGCPGKNKHKPKKHKRVVKSKQNNRSYA